MAKFHYKDSPTTKQRNAFKPYLAEDEELILVTGLSSAYLRNKFIIYFFFPGIIFGILAGATGWMLGVSKLMYLVGGGVVMLVAAGFKTFHLYHANRYLLTTRRVMIKKGIFGVKLTAALFDKITHIEVDQSFLDRLLLHHGDIIINTAGTNKNEIIIKFVDYPIELKNLLERLITRERQQFGGGSFSASTVEGEIIN